MEAHRYTEHPDNPGHKHLKCMLKKFPVILGIKLTNYDSPQNMLLIQDNVLNLH